MTYTGPEKYPGASLSYFWQDSFGGDRMETNVCLWHTTEGTALDSYQSGAVAPNLTVLPLIAQKTVKWYQHFDVDCSSRALVNLSGGVQTNTLNVVQVELIGTCDPAHKDAWGTKKAGVDYIYWPDAPDWLLAELGKFARWLQDNHGVPLKSTVTFKAYPGSYGTNNGVRLTGAQWEAYTGHLGHQHAPENLHGDPGSLDIVKILAFAAGTEEDMPLSADDITKVAQAVYDKLADGGGVLNQSDLDRIWRDDVIPAATPPFNNSDYFAADGTTVANPTWTATYTLSTMVRDIRDTIKRVKGVEASVAELQTAGVDLDALAKKVADLLAARLAD